MASMASCGSVDPPLFPTMAFMDRLNSSDARRGKPLLSPLDPLAMLLWHQFTELQRTPFRLPLTGC